MDPKTLFFYVLGRLIAFFLFAGMVYCGVYLLTHSARLSTGLVLVMFGSLFFYNGVGKK